MWQLISDNTDKRIYSNPATGSKINMNMVYIDKDSNKWWLFDDLTAMPYTRQFAATKVSSLYALGLTKDDLSVHVNGLKTILKSDDPEKYEKAYANIIEFESKANVATDAIKQMSALVPVYFTFNDEDIDSFENNLQIRKMSLLEADSTMHSFFLNLQLTATERFLQVSKMLSQIVLPAPQENQDPLI